MTRNEVIVSNAQQDVEQAKHELATRMRNLAGDLTRAAESVEEDQTVNSLGVVQSQGSDVDRLCGELNLRKNTLELLCMMNENAVEAKATAKSVIGGLTGKKS